MPKFTLPAGAYYLGDPCYVIKKRWQEVCDEFYKDESEAKIINILDKPFFMGNTKYGDGEYCDNKGHKYGVDSGCIGLVPISLIDAFEDDNKLVEFDRIVKIEYDDGIFNFNDIIINTDEEEDVD